MDTILRKGQRKPTAADVVYLVKAGPDLKKITLPPEVNEFIKKAHRLKQNVVEVNFYKNRSIFVFGEFLGVRSKRLEDYRKRGCEAQAVLNKAKIERTVIYPLNATKEEILAFAEGLLLGNYQFLKYRSDIAEKENSLEQVDIYSEQISEDDIEELRIVVESVYNARDMVNEPVAYLNATRFAEEMKTLATESNSKIEIFNKKKIESLKMGGLLAVNKGSVDPPTFTIIEWKPEKPINKKPYVFVGKGVVYDTGGLNIKPFGYMDIMKCDMAGGAAVAGAMYAIAKAQLPVHVIGLVPATDNRLNGNAYAPGDVITMYNGSTVEVINTDAEGRMILADALAYAKQYDPELVIDVATLTGAAVMAFGHEGMAGMNVKADQEFESLQKAGNKVHERIVELPMWDDYKEMLKSEVADQKNIGGKYAGTITAAKFLEAFTDYPYIHLDIAGPSFLEKPDSYRGIGGTGVGVRLLYDFIKSKTDK